MSKSRWPTWVPRNCPYGLCGRIATLVEEAEEETLRAQRQQKREAELGSLSELHCLLRRVSTADNGTSDFARVTVPHVC